VNGWNETVLYSFCATGNENTCSDGAEPSGGLILDAAGNLYGTTSFGGSGLGTVFELSPPSIPRGTWTETVLWTFSGSRGGDGAYPLYGRLNRDKTGNLYGSTIAGGTQNLGTVFELSPILGGGWNEKILHSFDGNNGSSPEFGVAIDQSGDLFGTTNSGGIVNSYSFCAGGCGLVYELKTSGVKWTETVVYKFDGKTGAQPYSAVSIDQLGNLYGTFEYGGSVGNCFANDGCGGIFKLSPNGSGGVTQYSFLFDGQDGGNPESGVLVDGSTGDIFGTTLWGNNIYMIKGRKETVLYQFCSLTDCEDGEYPEGGTLVSHAEALYGVTLDGGAKRV
jgi:uncharacterized repeat protein (TIGR03803 family)